MEENLLATLDLVAPHLPVEWVDPSALARVRSLCAHLPHSDCSGLECRLDPRDVQVDLATFLDVGTLRTMAHAPGWERLASFLEACERIPKMVVAEFDLPADGQAVPPPALFLPGSVRPRDVSLLQPILTWWEAVSGIEARGWATRLAALLPEGAVGGVGLYFSRSLQSLRYCIQGLKPSEWLALLSGLGGHPAAAQLERLPKADMFSFTLDIGCAPGPDLGVELHLLRVPRIEPRWKPLLRALERMGIDAGQLAPAGFWAGSMARGVPDLVQELLDGPPPRHLYWRVSHLKLIMLDGEPPKAKIYLMFRHVEKSRDGSRENERKVSKSCQ